MAEYSLHVDINLNGLRAEMQKALQRTIIFVSAGLRDIETIDVEELKLPTASITMQYAANLKWKPKRLYLREGNGSGDSS